MKKFMSVALLSLILTQTSQAAIGGMTALFNPVIGGKIALTGLATAGAGTIGSLFYRGSCGSGECLAPLFFGVSIGLILLDEANGKIEFTKIDPASAHELGLKKFEVLIFNSEVEEANLVLSEVISQINESTTHEDVTEIWSEYESILSPESFNVMKALASKKQ